MSEHSGGDDPEMEDFDGQEAGPPPAHAPVAALQAERRRRQAAERERDALLAQLNGAETDEAPDEADPEEEIDGTEENPAFDDAFDALNAHLNASEEIARSRFGDAAVDAAETWAEQALAQDPALAAEVLTHGDPYAFALGLAMAAQEGPGERGGGRGAGPPRSLISAPSAGGPAHVPSGPGQAYDALFSHHG